MYDPLAHRWITAVENVDVELYASVVVVVATFTFITRLVFVTELGAEVEVVPALNIRLFNAAPAYAVKLEPRPEQVTNESVTIRSLSSVLRIEVEVAEPVAGLKLI